MKNLKVHVLVMSWKQTFKVIVLDKELSMKKQQTNKNILTEIQAEIRKNGVKSACWGEFGHTG